MLKAMKLPAAILAGMIVLGTLTATPAQARNPMNDPALNALAMQIWTQQQAEKTANALAAQQQMQQQAALQTYLQQQQLAQQQAALAQQVAYNRPLGGPGWNNGYWHNGWNNGFRSSGYRNVNYRWHHDHDRRFDRR